MTNSRLLRLYAANVVPIWVEMSLDICDLSDLHIEGLLKQLRRHVKSSFGVADFRLMPIDLYFSCDL